MYVELMKTFYELYMLPNILGEKLQLKLIDEWNFIPNMTRFTSKPRFSGY